MTAPHAAPRHNSQLKDHDSDYFAVLSRQDGPPIGVHRDTTNCYHARGLPERVPVSRAWVEANFEMERMRPWNEVAVMFCENCVCTRTA